MQHLTAIRMLMMARSTDRRVDLVIRGHPFHIDSIERVIVPSKEARLAATAGLEGLETHPQLGEHELQGLRQQARERLAGLGQRADRPVPLERPEAGPGGLVPG